MPGSVGSHGLILYLRLLTTAIPMLFPQTVSGENIAFASDGDTRRMSSRLSEKLSQLAALVGADSSLVCTHPAGAAVI